MNPPVTMQQIAERAGVSLGTVSHVINNTAKVREKLRERVLEAIRGLGYQPSQLARGLRRNGLRNCPKGRGCDRGEGSVQKYFHGLLLSDG